MKKNNNFFANTIALIGSSSFSQIIAIVASVIEARIYSPKEMGMYATFIAILAVLTVVVCLQYERAIVLIFDEIDRRKMLSQCFLIVLSITILVFLITMIFSGRIASLLNIPELASWIKLMPASLFMAGTISVMMYWNIKNSNIKLIATINIITVLTTNAFQILFGIKRMHLPGGMIVGHLIGNSFAALIYIAKSKAKRLEKPSFTLFRRYKQFPIYSVPSTFLDTLGANSPNILLAYFFGAKVTGYYALGYRLLSIPVSVICNSIVQAFLPKAVDAHNNNTLDSAALTILDFILKIGMVPLLLVAMVSKEIIVIIFGDVWSYSAHFIPWLCFMLLSGMLYSPISNILIVLERQRDGLVINTISIMAKVAALIVGGLLESVIGAIILYSITGGFVALISCVYVLKLAKVTLWETSRLFLNNLLRSCLFILPTLVVILCTDNSMVRLTIGVSNGLLFLCFFGKDMVSIIRNNE